MESVDTVVVGSGFGGSAVACRLAGANGEVVVLERRKAFPPGSFPRSPAGVGRNFWDPAQGVYGMFNLWSCRGLEAVVSSGLGGGSLIYANVLLRKDERWFREADGWEWPLSRKTLDPYYMRAEAAIGGEPYPFHRAPYAATPKTAAMREAAARLRDTRPERVEW